MSVQKHQGPGFLAASLCCGLLLVAAGCRRPSQSKAHVPAAVPLVDAELQKNQLGGLPGAVYQRMAGSPIHWQPWTKATLDRAKAANRMVFCVIVLPQQPGFLKDLEELAADRTTVEVINHSYVPVLVDGNACREMGVLAADLCAEIKRPLRMPLMLWMTHEANPVAWVSTAMSDSHGIRTLFNQSHTMVSKILEDDMKVSSGDATVGYVMQNSARDNAGRRERLQQRIRSVAGSVAPAEDVVRGIRQLASLYDPSSRSFDEAGGLFPSGSLELLATASVNPGLGPELRRRCLDTTRDLFEDLVTSAMFDPLDGGMFSFRQSLSWDFPAFTRDCFTHARTVVALAAVYRATADKRALDKVLGLVAFAERNYATKDGLFAIGVSDDTDSQKWMWRVEDVESALGAEDAAWWIKATGMKHLGNLPSEADPERRYFRENTLRLGRSIPEIAADLGISPEVCAAKLDAARSKLLAMRNARLGEMRRDDCPDAVASFRMVSAYAAAFGITGDDTWRQKAVSLMKRSWEAFEYPPTQVLREYDWRGCDREAPWNIGAGRAFLYALAMQSALDVSHISSDLEWSSWAEGLAARSERMFAGNGYLQEFPEEAKLINLPVCDQAMLFDDSTVGLFSMVQSRMIEPYRPFPPELSRFVTKLPANVVDRPILHTDLLLAMLARHDPVIVVEGGRLDNELKNAVERLPIRSVHRRHVRSGEEVAAGSVKVVLPGGHAVPVTNSQELQQAVLPSREK